MKQRLSYALLFLNYNIQQWSFRLAEFALSIFAGFMNIIVNVALRAGVLMSPEPSFPGKTFASSTFTLPAALTTWVKKGYWS